MSEGGGAFMDDVGNVDLERGRDGIDGASGGRWSWLYGLIVAASVPVFVTGVSSGVNFVSKKIQNHGDGGSRCKKVGRPLATDPPAEGPPPSSGVPVLDLPAEVLPATGPGLPLVGDLPAEALIPPATAPGVPLVGNPATALLPEVVVLPATAPGVPLLANQPGSDPPTEVDGNVPAEALILPATALLPEVVVLPATAPEPGSDPPTEVVDGAGIPPPDCERWFIIVFMAALSIVAFVLPGTSVKNDDGWMLWLCAVAEDIAFMLLLQIKENRLQDCSLSEIVVHELHQAALFFHFAYLVVRFRARAVVVATGAFVYRLALTSAYVLLRHVPEIQHVEVAGYVAASVSVGTSLAPFLWGLYCRKRGTCEAWSPSPLAAAFAASVLWFLWSGMNKEKNLMVAYGVAAVIGFSSLLFLT